MRGCPVGSRQIFASKDGEKGGAVRALQEIGWIDGPGKGKKHELKVEEEENYETEVDKLGLISWVSRWTLTS